MFVFESELWLYEGTDPWHFVSLPTDLAEEVREISAGQTRGFGSLRVNVTIGGTTWKTSIFPDKKLGTFLLPVKREVRMTERVEEGDRVTVRLQLVDF